MLKDILVCIPFKPNTNNIIPLFKKESIGNYDKCGPNNGFPESDFKRGVSLMTRTIIQFLYIKLRSSVM